MLLLFSVFLNFKLVNVFVLSPLWNEAEVDVVRSTGISGSDDLYFEVLQLQPIKLNLSFERTETPTIEKDSKFVFYSPR